MGGIRLAAMAMLVGAVVLLAPGAGVVSAAPEPVDSEEYVEFIEFVGSLACPDLGDPALVLVERPFNPGSRIIDGVRYPNESGLLSCEYDSSTVEPTDGARLRVSLSVAFDSEFVPFECRAEPSESRDDPRRQRIDLGRVSEARAISLNYEVSEALLDAHAPAIGRIPERFGAWAGELEPIAMVCQYDAPTITCPSVAGFVEEGGEEPRLDHLMFAECDYASAAGDETSRLALSVAWATDRSEPDAQRRACQDFGPSPRPRLDVIGGDGISSEVHWRFAGPTDSELLDPAAFEAAAIDLRAQVGEHTVTCEAEWVVSPWTPVPPYLAEVYAPERIDAPPMPNLVQAGFFGGGTDLRESVVDPTAPTTPVVGTSAPAAEEPTVPLDDVTAAAEPAGGAPAGDEPPAPTGSDGDGGASLLQIVLTVVGLTVSLLALGLAFLMIRKESRVRPKMDIARLVIVLVVAAAMMVLFSNGAPWWAVVVAVVAGGALGWFQGRNLEVRVVGERLMAKRGAVAIVLFAVGLVLAQIAGLLNRTGVIALGVALSFLSAATTAGLVAGRRPKVVAARQAVAAGFVLLLVGSLAAASLDGARRVNAQDDGTEPTEPVEPAEPVDPAQVRCGSVVPGERCEATEELIDLVDWGQIDLNGGLLWDRSKPWITFEVPRGLDAIPDAVSRDVEWTHSFSTDGSDPSAYSITETFTFGVNEDGVCCSVLYDGSGVETTAGGVVNDYTLVGQLDDIEPTGSGIDNYITFSSARGVPFDEASRFRFEPEDACHRAVAGTVPNMSRNQADAVYTRNGEVADASDLDTAAVLAAGCELEGFDVDAAIAAAPELAPRSERGSPCPANIELYPALQGEGFELQAVKTLGPLFTAPYEAACGAGGLAAPLQFGPAQPGQTRSEFAFEYGSIEAQTVWGDDSAMTDVFRPADIDEDDRCETDASGRAVDLPEGENCRMISMHHLDDAGSWLWIFTDNQHVDGPNVTIRASLPWGSYWYNCHHCEPSSPEVQRFIGQFHDVSVEWIDSAPDQQAGDLVVSETGTVGAPTTVVAGDVPVDDPDDTATSDEGAAGDDANDDAAAAAAVALIGLLGSAGVLGTAIAESGRTPAEILDALRRGGVEGLNDLLGGELPPDAVVDERGEVLRPGDDGLYGWETPDGTERLTRDEIEERIAVEQAAIDARRAEHEAIVAEHESDAAATERFGDLLERTIAENDALMDEIRDAWDRIDERQSALDRRDAALAGLEAAEAEQEYEGSRTSWDQITVEAVEGMERDVAGLPGEVVDATRVVVTELADPENWRVVGETAAETLYDALGMAAGNSFGDGAESVGNGVRFGGELGVALATAMARDPVGTIAALTPINDFANAVDGERTLGERLTSLGIGLADVAATLAGLGWADAADDLMDAARAAEAAQDAIGAGVDTARVVDATGDVGLGVARVADEALAPAMLQTRDEIADAIRAAQREAARRGVPVERVLADMPETRGLFQGSGMAGMGALETAGGLSDEMAQAVVRMHDEITGRAVDIGARNALDEMYEIGGMRPQRVLVGNSGSVGAARSVMTDADRTVVLVFADDQLDSWRASRGLSRAEAQDALQSQFRDLHRRHAELALNDPTDPAVILARQEGLELQEAVARLQAAGADDPAAAAVRLNRDQMDMQTYSGFGSLEGADDLYPAGFTQSRQSIQGSTDVYRIDPDTGAVTNYQTSGQAIVDQHELNRLQTTGNLTPTTSVNPTDPDAWRWSDPTRIPDTELPDLLRNQVEAVDHYNDVKSIAKAVDRVEYIASRTGRPMADRALVDAAVAIRANPRGTAGILAELGMSEQQFMEASQAMVRSYGTGV